MAQQELSRVEAAGGFSAEISGFRMVVQALKGTSHEVRFLVLHQADGLTLMGSGIKESWRDAMAAAENPSCGLSEDYEVASATRVDEALLVFASQRIDVVLLDYHLIDGHALDVAGRADRAGVPVVWIPGEPGVVEKFIRASHFLLAKPFGIQQVLDVLAKARGCQ